MIRRFAIGVFVVTLAGCTYPKTKMEPVYPTTSDNPQQSAAKKAQRWVEIDLIAK